MASNIRDLVKIRRCVDMTGKAGKIHESCFQSYHVLVYVQDLLERGTPGDVVLELIKEIDDLTIEKEQEEIKNGDQ